MDLVAEPGAHEGADRVAGVARRGSSGSSAARSLAPPRQQRGCAASAQRCRPGTPSSRPSGIGCRPSYQTAAVAAVGDVSSVAEPDVAGERGGVGHAGEEGVGALVDGRQPGER